MELADLILSVCVWVGVLDVTLVNVLNPSSIGLYPVHLHRLPSNALSNSSIDGWGLLRNSVYIDMTIPGVQKPHCDPWLLASLSYHNIAQYLSRIYQ